MRKLPLALCSIFFVFTISFGGLFPAHAATFYVDLGTLKGTPNNTYGGPAGLATGYWIGIGSLGTTNNLIDIGNNSTSVSLTVAANGWSNVGTATSTEQDKLLYDAVYAGIGSSYTLTFTNLTNGAYDVYLNAADSSVFAVTKTGNITVNGSGVAEFTSGYRSLRTTVSSGTLTIIGTTASSNTKLLAGVQVQAVPIPGALWLLGSGLVGLVGIRRKLKK